MAFYSAYPIIPKEKDKFKLQQHFSNYDAHFVPVSPDDPDNEFEENYYPTDRTLVPTYKEMVVFEESSCYPRFLVTLKMSDEIDRNPQLCSSSSLMLFMKAQEYKIKDPSGEYKTLLYQAAEQGSELALYELGWYYKKAYKSISPSNTEPTEDITKQQHDFSVKAFNCFHKAAERGLMTAKLEEAFCYKWGIGVKKDPVQAVTIFKSIKDPKADYELGFHYYKGEGVEKDYSLAFKHWEFAAKRYIGAAYRLGLCYEHGWGTEKNLVTARTYFQRVVDERSPDANSATQEIHNIDTILETEKKDDKEEKNLKRVVKGREGSPHGVHCKIM